MFMLSVLGFDKMTQPSNRDKFRLFFPLLLLLFFFFFCFFFFYDDFSFVLLDILFVCFDRFSASVFYGPTSSFLLPVHILLLFSGKGERWKLNQQNPRLMQLSLFPVTREWHAFHTSHSSRFTLVWRTTTL